MNRIRSRRPNLRLAGFVLFIATLAMISHSGCAGYQIGHRSMYRPDIRTIYVPMFQSDSFRRNLSERLTEAVVRELEANTSYKVVSDPDADSVPTGRILFDRKNVIAENRFDDARDIEVDMMVEVTWQDRRGDVIPQIGLPLEPVVTSVSNAGHFIPESGQSLATAQQRGIQRLAEQIVARMQTPW